MGLEIGNVLYQSAVGSLSMAGRQLVAIGSGPQTRQSATAIDGRGYWVLPGLVNAHDHLHLDLLPPLGTPPYPNSKAWGEDVWKPEHPPIRDIWLLSRSERLLWGAYRNLLAGVTTVQHHDRGHPSLAFLPVRVPAYRWRHRPGSRLGGRWGFGRSPLFVHCGEGTDLDSYGEVAQLAAAGELDRSTVLVHAIALGASDIVRIARAGAGVVVCPQSNRYLYQRVAPLEAIHGAGIPLALGTDSTASGSTDLLAELRASRGLLPDGLLYDMVTATAAKLLGVPGLGRLVPGGAADFILVDSPGATSEAEALMKARPGDVRLVVRSGRPVLVGEEFFDALGRGLALVLVDGAPMRLAGPIRPLLERTRRLLGERLYFGRRIE